MRTVEDLYRAHARHVLAYALRRTGAATADDVVSEVFLIVERRLADVPADARPWLYGVARRVLANQRRSDSRRAALQVALGVLARDSAPVPPPEFDAGTPLLTALAALRPDDREVLMLTAWEGLGARDGATVLGCSTAAFHTRLHRARTRLQAETRSPDRADAPDRRDEDRQMSDLLEDLHHANPIDPDTVDAPPYARRARPPAPRRRAWRLTLAATGGALLTVAAVALIPGRASEHDGTLAARAFAAVTKPGVVHWRTALRTHVGDQGNTQTVTEGWSHDGVTHILMWELYNHKPRLGLELRTANGRTTTWSPTDEHPRQSKAMPATSDPNHFGDPMASFRRAYKTGKLTPLGRDRLKVDLPGRSDDEGEFTAYYDIDPKTSRPVRYVVTQPGGPTMTVQFRVYETLPSNATNLAKLRPLDRPAPASDSTTALAHFAVLRQGTPPTGKLGAAVRRATRFRHLDASTARKVAPGIALIPSDDGVCLIAALGSGTGSGCTGLTHALERGIGMGVPNPGPLPKSRRVTRLKAGVDLAVPDGVAAVKTRFHGRWTRRPVHGNFIHLPRFSGQYVFVKR